ncbi:MAG: hypothetical protein M0R51_02735 [Clostridia bacterium]|jgi:sporulation integral membrane protein YlbJ|nr:hypothetical protein [Clostridia bacterium]
MKKINIFLSILIIFIIALFIFNPQVYSLSVLKGILLWATALLPTLFPFFFLTKILTELGAVNILANYLSRITKKLFNVGGIAGYVYIMSIISGYPVGAKLTAELYEHNLISKEEAARIVTFTSTSGPLFIIGTVGIGMFLSRTAGIIILCSHFLGAIINGLIYRNYKYKKALADSKFEPVQKNLNTILSESIYNSIISILIVGGYVAIFYMLIDMLNNSNLLLPFKNISAYLLNIFKKSPAFSEGLVNGIIEITRGCYDLSSLKAVSLSLCTITATFIISWGGLSIHMQALTFLCKCKINIGFYFLQKLTHAICSTIICILILIFFKPL